MKIELSIEQLQIIGQALEQGPYKLVAPVLAYLQKEINANHAAETTSMTRSGNGAEVVAVDK